VAPETPVRQALSFITQHNISQLPVVSEGDCVGHLSEATLMSRVLENTATLEQSVQHLMDAPLPVVDAHVDLPGITRLLNRQNPPCWCATTGGWRGSSPATTSFATSPMGGEGPRGKPIQLARKVDGRLARCGKHVTFPGTRRDRARLV
jgi:hypothetical protein